MFLRNATLREKKTIAKLPNLLNTTKFNQKRLYILWWWFYWKVQMKQKQKQQIIDKLKKKQIYYVLSLDLLV